MTRTRTVLVHLLVFYYAMWTVALLKAVTR
jgi:hypothetical protein